MLASLALFTLPAALGGGAFDPTVLELGISFVPESATPQYLRDHVAGDERFVVVANPDGPVAPLSFSVLDMEDGSTSFLDGPAALFPTVRNGLLAYPLPETVDLNGDGDTSDVVVQVVDLESGLHWSTGLAAARKFQSPTPDVHLVVGRDWVAFLVDEKEQGADLDGDGAVAGRVVHLFDAKTGEIENYGVRSLELFGNDTAFAFSVPESDVDLNGDGDLLDNVAHLVRPRDGSLQNIGIAGLVCNISERVIAVTVQEEDEGGVDFNGDGDAVDTVIHAVDARTLAMLNTGLAVFSISPSTCLTDGATLAFLGNEFAQEDLDGDGDATDFVWHAYNAQTAELINLGVAATIVLAPGGPSLVDGILALIGDESLSGVDFSGDGARDDRVRLLYRFETGELINTHVPVFPWSFATKGYLVDLISESSLGGVDLNGDGDGVDQVYSHLNFRAAAHLNLSLAGTLAPVLLPDLALLQVNEGAQGGQDLNGDGDSTDQAVVHLLDPTSGATFVPGQTTSEVVRAGGAIVYLASEVLHGVDYNGDGDLFDQGILAAFP